MTSQTMARLTARFALGMCLLVVAVAGQAQNLQRSGGAYTLPPGSMPSWAVPVLRLVSATHVEPTTGIILSDTGLVLVPDDFAADGDEIIVLDGGTDIIRNGRPARIERRFSAEGVLVLSVEGLRRGGVTLGAGPIEPGGEVVLAAFPPAELIIEGEPPLSIPASVDIFAENGRPVISGETALPNVTGALVDACGNLAGVSLADDIQSMEVSPATRYRWRDSLVRILEAVNIAVRESDCAPAEEEPPPEPEIEESAPEEAAEEEPAPEEVVDEEEPVAEPEPEEPQPEETLPEVLPPLESSDTAEAEPEQKPNYWLWLVAALVLFGLGFVLHRVRRSRNLDKDGRGDDGSQPNNSVAGASADEEPEPQQPRLDSELHISGTLADGTRFEASCPVSEHAINITIGRGGTDLVIASRAVSRKHVTLNGPWSELTVCDLGSSNGTSINGVPCLEGEIMYTEPGDVLILGDARCELEIRPHPGAGSGAA